MTFSEDTYPEAHNGSINYVSRYPERSNSLASILEEGQSSVSSISSETLARYDATRSSDLRHSFIDVLNETDELHVEENDSTRTTLLDGLRHISLDGSTITHLERQIEVARRSMRLGHRPRPQKEYLDAIRKYLEDGGEQCDPLVSTVVAELAQSFDYCTKDEIPTAVCICLDLLKTLMSAVLPDPKIYTSVLSTLDRLFGAHGGTHQNLIMDRMIAVYEDPAREMCCLCLLIFVSELMEYLKENMARATQLSLQSLYYLRDVLVPYWEREDKAKNSSKNKATIDSLLTILDLFPDPDEHPTRPSYSLIESTITELASTYSSLGLSCEAEALFAAIRSSESLKAHGDRRTSKPSVVDVWRDISATTKTFYRHLTVPSRLSRTSS